MSICASKSCRSHLTQYIQTGGKGGPLDDVLPAIATRLSKDYGKTVTPAQVLMKWLIQKDVIIIT